MKLYVDTINRTEVEPNENGTIPQYYAYCIQSALECLNNSKENIEKARNVFLSLMNGNEETANLIRGNTTLLRMANDCGALQRAMSGYVVPSSNPIPYFSLSNEDTQENEVKEYYAYCIGRAKAYLNNTEDGLLNAKASFLNDMKGRPETAEMVEGIYADVVLIAKSDEALLKAISGYRLLYTVNPAEDPSHNNIKMIP